jgi:glycerophosphoryl diester phosphodiesterase
VNLQSSGVNPSFPFLDHPLPLAFAHRGGASDSPENTIAAFETSVALGYRYLETDVHVTADGVLVAFHDEQLDRVTDRQGRICDLDWDEVRRARVAGADGSVGEIPRMEDLFAAFPTARFNIDPKADASVDPLAEAITRCNAIDRVLVCAFSDRRIARARELLGPGLCTGLGPKGVARLRAAASRLPAGRFSAGAAQVPVSAGKVPLVTEAFIATAHRRGLQVHVWTIDDAAEMHRLLDLGVDGIMTDRPTVLRDVLIERGTWS